MKKKAEPNFRVLGSPVLSELNVAVNYAKTKGYQPLGEVQRRHRHIRDNIHELIFVQPMRMQK